MYTYALIHTGILYMLYINVCITFTLVIINIYTTRIYSLIYTCIHSCLYILAYAHTYL